MARDQVDMTPIETREELIAWFEAGSKPKSQFRIGTEHEKFVFTVEGHNPVPYDGSRSIRALLKGMQHLLGWEPIIENGNIIGLFDVTSGGAISLEPGGQFELSGAPLETVHQTCSELMAHLAQVKEIARPLGSGGARLAVENGRLSNTQISVRDPCICVGLVSPRSLDASARQSAAFPPHAWRPVTITSLITLDDLVAQRTVYPPSTASA